MLALATAPQLVDGLQFTEQIVVAAAQRGSGGRGSSIVVAFFWSSWPPLQSVGTPAWPPSPSPVSSSAARAAQHYYRESKSASILKVNF